MAYEQIIYEVRGTTAIITLNRPEKRNALSARLLQELNAALREADEYNPVHAVVLRGAGPHFCAGADLSEYSASKGPDYRGREEIDDDIFSSVVRVDDVSYSNGVGGAGGGLTLTCEKLPEPTEFGDGNPFLMFLCLVRYILVIRNIKFSVEDCNLCSHVPLNCIFDLRQKLPFSLSQ